MLWRLEYRRFVILWFLGTNLVEHTYLRESWTNLESPLLFFNIPHFLFLCITGSVIFDIGLNQDRNPGKNRCLVKVSWYGRQFCPFDVDTLLAIKAESSSFVGCWGPPIYSPIWEGKKERPMRDRRAVSYVRRQTYGQASRILIIAIREYVCLIAPHEVDWTGRRTYRLYRLTDRRTDRRARETGNGAKLMRKDGGGD